MIAASQTVEFFIQADFAAEVGSRNVIGFDIPNQADGALAGEEYLGCGLTIIQIDGNDINIVGNLAPGSFGGNYVTEANIDSAPNAISSSTNVGGAADQPDNFDLVTRRSEAGPSASFSSSRIRARAIIRAGCVPRDTTRDNFARSPAVSVTTCSFGLGTTATPPDRVSTETSQPAIPTHLDATRH